MTLLHIDIEALRSTVRQMIRAADEIDWQVQRLESARHYLETSWEGSGKYQFQNDLEYQLHTLRKLSRELHHYSHRLQKKADEWERISGWI